MEKLGALVQACSNLGLFCLVFQFWRKSGVSSLGPTTWQRVLYTVHLCTTRSGVLLTWKSFVMPSMRVSLDDGLTVMRGSGKFDAS